MVASDKMDFPFDPSLSKLRNKQLLQAMRSRLIQLELLRHQIAEEDVRLGKIAGKLHDKHKQHEDDLLEDIMTQEPGSATPLEDARAFHQEERAKALSVWHEADKRGKSFAPKIGESKRNDDSTSD